MGIPKLIQTLQPFAESVVLGRSNNNSISTSHNGNNQQNQTPNPDLSSPRITSLVIDGPSLIYHIYHRLLSLKAQAQAQAQAQSHQHQYQHQHPLPPKHTHPHPHPHSLLYQPTYTEINHAVLIFITYLQSHCGVEVQTIYFDGALPASKREVRLARLEEGRRKLVEFRRVYEGFPDGGEGSGRGACGGCSGVEDGDEGSGHESREGGINSFKKEDITSVDAASLFLPNPPLPSPLKLLPPPPFMVPAAIEYLRSHFSSRPPTNTSPIQHKPQRNNDSSTKTTIQLVPTEADPHCALHARQTGAAILTSDSDLLAYDLRPRGGGVVLLNSLELRLGTEGERQGEGQGEGPVVVGTRYHGPSLNSKLNLDLNLPTGSSSSSGGGSDGCTPLQRLIFERAFDPTISISELKRRCLMPSSFSSSSFQSQKMREWSDFLLRYSTEDISHPDRAGEGEESGDEDDMPELRPLQFALLPNLDPRLAELVVQFRHLASSPTHHPHPQSRSLSPSKLSPLSPPNDHHKPNPQDNDNDDDDHDTKAHPNHNPPEQNLKQDINLPLHIYLPPLIEDPTRDSAWNYGREIRALGYGLLRWHFADGGSVSLHRVGFGRKRKGGGREEEEEEEEDGKEGKEGREERSGQVRIVEYYRRGTRIVGIPANLPSEQDIETRVHSLLDGLRTHKSPPHLSPSSSFDVNPPPPSDITTNPRPNTNSTNPQFWHSFALTLLTHQRLLSHKPAPGSAWAYRHLNPNPECRPYAAPQSWDDVHNQACVQAVLYSLRLLKQIIITTTGLLVRSSSTSSSSNSSSPSISCWDNKHRDEGVGSVRVQQALAQALESLPSSLPELFGEVDIETNTRTSADAATRVSSRAAARGEIRLGHSGGEGARVGGRGYK